MTEPEAPAGLVYQPDFLTSEEERDLIAVLESMKFDEIHMHGQTARRTVRHFGLDYDYQRWKVTPTEPLPESLEWLLERLASSTVNRPSSRRSCSRATRRGRGSAGTGTRRCLGK